MQRAERRARREGEADGCRQRAEGRVRGQCALPRSWDEGWRKEEVGRRVLTEGTEGVEGK